MCSSVIDVYAIASVGRIRVHLQSRRIVGDGTETVVVVYDVQFETIE